MVQQLHLPNPSVDRKNRPRILRKRVRCIENKLPLRVSDIRLKRLADYKAELEAR